MWTVALVAPGLGTKMVGINGTFKIGLRDIVYCLTGQGRNRAGILLLLMFILLFPACVMVLEARAQHPEQSRSGSLNALAEEAPIPDLH